MTLLEMLLLFWNNTMADYEKLGSLFYEGKSMSTEFRLITFFPSALSA